MSLFLIASAMIAFAPEAVIDPEAFLAKLEPLGVKVEEHEG